MIFIPHAPRQKTCVPLLNGPSRNRRTAFCGPRRHSSPTPDHAANQNCHGYVLMPGANTLLARTFPFYRVPRHFPKKPQVFLNVYGRLCFTCPKEELGSVKCSHQTSASRPYPRHTHVPTTPRVHCQRRPSLVHTILSVGTGPHASQVNSGPSSQSEHPVTFETALVLARCWAQYLNGIPV